MFLEDWREEIQKDLCFEKRTHTYRFKELPMTSVTTLLKEQGWTADYSTVPKYSLENAICRGNSAHLLLKDVFEKRVVDLEKVAENVRPYVDAMVRSEFWKRFQTGADVGDYAFEFQMYDLTRKIAGTADFIGKVYLPEKYYQPYQIWDLKTGNVSYLDFWTSAWQVAIYKYIFNLASPVTVDPVEKTGIWYFEKDDKDVLQMKEMETTDWIPLRDVRALLDSFHAKELYRGNKVILPTEVVSMMNELSQQASVVDTCKKMYEYQKEVFDSLLPQALRKFNEFHVKNYKVGTVEFTLKKGYTSKRFSVINFKEDNPALYKKYVVESKIEDSMLCKVGDKED